MRDAMSEKGKRFEDIRESSGCPTREDIDLGIKRIRKHGHKALDATPPFIKYLVFCDAAEEA
jgi:hypothetical protein